MFSLGITVNSCLWPLTTAGRFVVRQNEKLGINKNKGTFVGKKKKLCIHNGSLQVIYHSRMKNEPVIVMPFIKRTKK